MPPSALAILRVSILAARHEDVHGERIGLSPHFLQGGFGFTKRDTQVGECVLESICPHVFR